MGEAVVQLADGRQVPYQRGAVDLATLADRNGRLTRAEARSALVARELSPTDWRRIAGALLLTE